MEYRYHINTTKAAMAAYPGVNVITDSHRPAVKGEASVKGETVVALCPITKGDEPTCDGQFSFAHVVHRALENHDALVDALRRLDGRRGAITPPEIHEIVRVALAKIGDQ